MKVKADLIHEFWVYVKLEILVSPLNLCYVPPVFLSKINKKIVDECLLMINLPEY